MNNFTDINIPQQLKQNLQEMGYTNPTEIQNKVIPIFLEKKDILASAQTGTGKTAAFLIPIIANLSENPDINCVIITPTRELAMQIRNVVLDMTKNMRWMRSVLLIGGESMRKQLTLLEKGEPRLIVGTPGRINDHLDRKSINLKRTSILILDETDRMLDMGFEVQINAIVQEMSQDKQVALFSATLPKAIEKIAEKYLKDPQRIVAGEVNKIATKIEQEVITTEDKTSKLLEVLENNKSDSVIIFVKTKIFAETLKKILRDNKFRADAIHGGLKQFLRTSMIKAYKEEKFKILVATDVASRGLDVPHISLVINYDLPENPEDFVHRLGRTARAGKEGKAITLVARGDNSKLYNIKKFTGEIVEEPKQKRSYGHKDSKSRSNYKFSGARDKFGNKLNNNGKTPFAGKRNNNSNDFYKKTNKIFVAGR